MKVDCTKPRSIFFIFPVGLGAIVPVSGYKNDVYFVSMDLDEEVAQLRCKCKVQLTHACVSYGGCLDDFPTVFCGKVISDPEFGAIQRAPPFWQLVEESGETRILALGTELWFGDVRCGDHLVGGDVHAGAGLEISSNGFSRPASHNTRRATTITS